MDDAIEVKLGQLLRMAGKKLVTAESCTGGLIADLITNIPGSSDYYLGGVVAYAYEMKMRLLGVHPETLSAYGAVSSETALEMAHGARMLMSGYYPYEKIIGLSVTGIAGPGGGQPGKPVGLVWLGLCVPEGDSSCSFQWDGSRIDNKHDSAIAAIKMVMDYLNGALFRTNRLEKIDMQARHLPDGDWQPITFTWRGHIYRVDDWDGRRWGEDDGEHRLVMALGEVFELVLSQDQKIWSIRPRRQPANTV